MSRESTFISALRSLAQDPSARGLLDDAAVLEVGGRHLVLTHDMIVEGVHFLSADEPEDVAWKLVAVNLSDLAAKGASPVGALLGYTLSTGSWDRRFINGLRHALGTFQLALLGGDTVSVPPGGTRSLGLTAIGEAAAPVPSRSGAMAGHLLWVSGSIGDGGAGLRVACGTLEGPASLADRYRRPQPRLALGATLAPLVSAMLDVSDGLLIDAARMAEASGVRAEIELGDIPLSDTLVATLGAGLQVRIDAAVAGDDYELMFAAPAEREKQIRQAGQSAGVRLTKIGRLTAGTGLGLADAGSPVPLPDRIGFEHSGGLPEAGDDFQQVETSNPPA